MENVVSSLTYGATLKGAQAEFRVWAPAPDELTLRLKSRSEQQDISMLRDGEDFVATAPAVAGDRYSYVFLRRIGCARSGVTISARWSAWAATEIVDPAAFRWSDAGRRGFELGDHVLCGDTASGTLLRPKEPSTAAVAACRSRAAGRADAAHRPRSPAAPARIGRSRNAAFVQALQNLGLEPLAATCRSTTAPASGGLDALRRYAAEIVALAQTSS